MSNSCDSIAEDLMKCVSKSQCVKDGGSRKDCLTSDSLEDECKGLYTLYTGVIPNPLPLPTNRLLLLFSMSPGAGA